MSQVARGSEHASVPITWSQQWQFTLKELRETLRDRRTVVTLLAMPLLLYPLLGVGMRFLAVQQTPGTAQEIRVAVATSEEGQWLDAMLKEGSRLLAQDESQRTRTEEPSRSVTESVVKDAASAESQNPSGPVVKLVMPNNPDSFNLEESITDGNADLGVRIRTLPSMDPRRPPTNHIEIIQLDNFAPGKKAAEYVQQRLDRLNLETAFKFAVTGDAQFQLPLQESIRRIGSSGSGRGTAILGLLPLILLLMTVTGGVYPAIDLTAGERERDTLETLMALPVPKYRLLLAKYAAVVAVTLLTGLMNLLAMTVTVFALNLESTLFGGSGLTFGLALRLLVTLTSFACFFSAVLLLLTSSARSFKEAQALLIPLLMLCLAPGLVIMLPGWSLSIATSVVPVINMLLLARGVFEGSSPALPAVIAIVSTILYAAVALTAAARIFGTDAVAIGSRGRWSELLSRPATKDNPASLSVAVFGLAVLLAMYFVASGFASRDAGAEMTSRLITSGLMTVLLFAGWPLLLLALRRISLTRGLALQAPSWRVLPAIVLIGVSAWPWVFEMVVGLQSLGVGKMDEARRQQVETLLSGWRSVSLPVILITLGVLPGLCEELFFRGFLFTGLRSRLDAASTIAMTAIVFGLFHVILAGGAAPQRVAPSMCLGLMLGWIRWRTGSVVPSMCAHVIHNSLLLTIAHFRDELQGWSVGALEETHLPVMWLIASGVGLAAGLVTLWLTTRRSAHDVG